MEHVLERIIDRGRLRYAEVHEDLLMPRQCPLGQETRQSSMVCVQYELIARRNNNNDQDYADGRWAALGSYIPVCHTNRNNAAGSTPLKHA